MQRGSDRSARDGRPAPCRDGRRRRRCCGQRGVPSRQSRLPGAAMPLPRRVGRASGTPTPTPALWRGRPAAARSTFRGLSPSFLASGLRPRARATLWSGCRRATLATLLSASGASSSETGVAPGAGAGAACASAGGPPVWPLGGGVGSEVGGETSSLGGASPLAVVSTGGEPAAVWPDGADSTSSSGTGAGVGDSAGVDCSASAGWSGGPAAGGASCGDGDASAGADWAEGAVEDSGASVCGPAGEDWPAGAAGGAGVWAGGAVGGPAGSVGVAGVTGPSGVASSPVSVRRRATVGAAGGGDARSGGRRRLGSGRIAPEHGVDGAAHQASRLGSRCGGDLDDGLRLVDGLLPNRPYGRELRLSDQRRGCARGRALREPGPPRPAGRERGRGSTLPHQSRLPVAVQIADNPRFQLSFKDGVDLDWRPGDLVEWVTEAAAQFEPAFY